MTFTTYRGKRCCVCMPPWLDAFERELLALRVIRRNIDVLQLTGSAPKSAGVHAEGGAADLGQTQPLAVWVARQMGADAAWARVGPAWEGNEHMHLVLTDCPHNGPARYQIDEVRAGGDGLVGSLPDPGPRPLSGRTWRQGVAWQKARDARRARIAEQLKLLRQQIADKRERIAALIEEQKELT